MKEFLFSRSHKKHYSSAVVRMGKNNLGFSLVELVIVIAIMAILVAVAIPVISVFIERSKIANDKQIVSDVMYAIDLGGQSMQYEFTQDQVGTSTALKVPIGIIILGDKEGITVIGSTAQNKASIEAVLEDTLGTTYSSSMALKYDGWANSTYASFFSSADEMMDKVDTIGTGTLNYLNNLNNFNLAVVKTTYADGKVSILTRGWSGWETKKSISIISRGYADAEEMTSCLAQAVSRVDRATFITKWTNLKTEREGFGLSALPNADGSQNKNAAREYYSAVRAAYSQCFSNYVKNNHGDHDNWEDHVNDIMGWGESGNDMLKQEAGDALGGIAGLLTGANDMTFPFSVSEESFARSDNASETNDDFVDCPHCESLWYEYYQSEQAKADAAAFYDTMVTGASYKNPDDSKPAYEGIIDWAKEETDTFTSLYDDATAEINKNDISIMITVYQDPETGLIYGECNTPGVLDE